MNCLIIYTSNIIRKMNGKRSLSLLCILILISFVNGSWVRGLANQQELKSGLEQNSQRVWLVYTGNQNLNLIENVAQVFRGMFQVAAIQGQQSLQIFGDNRENPITFNSQYSVQNIVKFVLDNVDQVINARSEVAKALKANQQFQQKQAQRAKKQWEDEQNLRKKSDTIVLTADSWSTFVNGRQAWLINFYEANCSACNDLNKQWEQISTAYKGKLKVAKLNITEPGNQILQQQIQLAKYPSVRFYKSGPKKVSQFAQFEGVHKRFSIQQWLNGKLQQKSTQVQIPRLNKVNYQSLCKASKNTCIIVFTEDEDSQTLQKIEQLSLKHLKKPITFLVSKKGQQNEFAQQTGVSSYPNTVMLYSKQKKYWTMGGLDFTAIDDAIGEISLGNRNNFVKYTFGEPSLK